MDKLNELLSLYFDAGVTEGLENRNHDTVDGIAQKALNDILDTVSDMISSERSRCANLLIMTNSEIRLMAGEVSPDEMLTVQAILSNRLLHVLNRK